MNITWRTIIIKLCFLIVPFIILALILLDNGGNGGVGGGGYDLSGLVYGLALFAVIILWLTYILLGYLWVKTPAERKAQHLLTISGITALILAWIITSHMF
ncbi:hypothetical protein [Pedobacter sp. Leaf176]|uniref:hypothetical protein n=1 Tax=Pedobacter sp. Leaf176 TaxID=1736286 RepID=UPI0006F5B095|nr:hypothetical protein [Pedobacter sp. Leaf176]KQR70192.1 hypothetical protein ASF92_09335 [Pedobacter sp. Leaf176]